MTATVIGVLLVVGPLAWLVQRDRREARALSTRAYVQSLVDRTLGGESFVTVHVTPRGLWTTGQVIVSVPGGWEWMVESVWPVLMARVPRGYELVVRRGGSANHRPRHPEGSRGEPRAAPAAHREVGRGRLT